MAPYRPRPLAWEWDYIDGSVSVASTASELEDDVPPLAPNGKERRHWLVGWMVGPTQSDVLLAGWLDGWVCGSMRGWVGG